MHVSDNVQPVQRVTAAWGKGLVRLYIVILIARCSYRLSAFIKHGRKRFKALMPEGVLFWLGGGTKRERMEVETTRCSSFAVMQTTIQPVTTYVPCSARQDYSGTQSLV